MFAVVTLYVTTVEFSRWAMFDGRNPAGASASPGGALLAPAAVATLLVSRWHPDLVFATFLLVPRISLRRRRRARYRRNHEPRDAGALAHARRRARPAGARADAAAIRAWTPPSLTMAGWDARQSERLVVLCLFFAAVLWQVFAAQP